MHTLLKRQLRRYFGDSFSVPEEWQGFIGAVNDAYQESDVDREMLERSLDIPISGRLMAVADVYDALISRRVYKPPFPHETAVAIIADGAGTHFDPEMVGAFLEIADQFHAIAQRYVDSAEAMTKSTPHHM